MFYSSLVALVALLSWPASARQPLDSILQATLQISCDHFSEPHKVGECMKELSQKGRTKLGSCPGQGPPLTLACLQECTSDTDCPATSKCCPHSCGVTCQPPTDLNQVSGLPKVPEKVKVKGVGRAKSKSVVVEWEHDILGEEVLYVGEMREEGGAAQVSQLGAPWHPVHKPPRRLPFFKLPLKPGHYYQFRIAAVNKNGSRGFSQPSAPFKLSILPKAPNPPENLNFTWLNTKNNTQLAGVFSWNPPASEIPVSRYNVFWSQRIASELTPHKEGSVLVQRKTVSHDRTSVRLKKLVPNRQYFLQVQAQSQYGKKKLVGEPASMILNATDNFHNFRSQHQRSEPVTKWKNLHLSFSKFTIVDKKLTTRVSWKSRQNLKHTVMWESTCGPKMSKTVPVTASHYDITGLQYDCSYNIVLREKGGGKKGKRSGKITFKTPTCRDFDPSACEDI